MASTSSDGGPTRVPRADAEAGQLRIERGLRGAKITTDPRLGDLLHGSWSWEPKIAAQGGAVTLTYPRFGLARLGTDEITLNASIPWDISIQGGVRQVSADLRGLELRSLRSRERAGSPSTTRPSAPSAATPSSPPAPSSGSRTT